MSAIRASVSSVGAMSCLIALSCAAHLTLPAMTTVASASDTQEEGDNGPCLEEYDRSCAELHSGQTINRTRVCRTENPPVATPCGDIVVNDVNVKDLRPAGAMGGGARGAGQIGAATERVITIYKYSCSNGVDKGECRTPSGGPTIVTAQCKNRLMSGNPCPQTPEP